MNDIDISMGYTLRSPTESKGMGIGFSVKVEQCIPLSAFRKELKERLENTFSYFISMNRAVVYQRAQQQSALVTALETNRENYVSLLVSQIVENCETDKVLMGVFADYYEDGIHLWFDRAQEDPVKGHVGSETLLIDETY